MNDPLLKKVMEAIEAREAALVVIDGPCGSGKTTLAKGLGERYGTQPIPMDDFFLPYEKRTPERFATPGGNIDHERFLSEVLGNIGRDFTYDRFDCATGSLLPRRHVHTPITIIEGSYSHHPAFEECYERLQALRVFVYTDEAEQLRRIRARNPHMSEMFQERWIPLEKSYFQAYDIRSRAHVVLLSQPAADA